MVPLIGGVGPDVGDVALTGGDVIVSNLHRLSSRTDKCHYSRVGFHLVNENRVNDQPFTAARRILPIVADHNVVDSVWIER